LLSLTPALESSREIQIPGNPKIKRPNGLPAYILTAEKYSARFETAKDRKEDLTTY